MKNTTRFFTVVAIAVVGLLSCAEHTAAQYSLQPAFPSLPNFSAPIEIQTMPDGSNRVIVVQQKGLVKIFNNSTSVSSTRTFFDISSKCSQGGGESGLLGCAFHPDYINNHFVFFNYTADVSGQLTSFISRFTVKGSGDTDIVDLSSEQVLLTVSQPFPNHNGGCLRFGPDGYLYASFGDGGSGGDPLHNGQNKSVFLGKILRLDVNKKNGSVNYGIPATNPFANNDQGYKEEIYSYGMRNVWKFSFDDSTGKLWAGDVGQDTYEEVDIISAGDNCGWNTMEGLHCYNSTGCDQTGLKLPVWEYSHSNGDNSITGGFVYHGSKMPELKNKYIYGDYVSGRVWAFDYNGGISPTNTLLVKGNVLSSFGVDKDGEIFVVAYGTGKVFRLQSDAGVGDHPEQLSNFNVTLQNTLLSRDNPKLDLIVNTDKAGAYSFTIIDALGREYALGSRNIFSNGTNLKFDLKNEIGLNTSGMYILRISDGNRSVTTKFIVE